MSSKREEDGADGAGLAVVIGSSGAIGGALARIAQESGRYRRVLGFSRSADPRLDLLQEEDVARAAEIVRSEGGDVRLLVNAAGMLHEEGAMPERALGQISPEHMARSFAINAIGPALVIKHMAPLLPRAGRSVTINISARVGSIADNGLGGWYSYRASKAALNQIVRTAAIELKRLRPGAVCVAIHPGTVESALSAPFHRSRLTVRPPEEAATHIFDLAASLTSEHNGGFFDWEGRAIPW